MAKLIGILVEQVYNR